jgi:uncharacterized membrane protein
MDQDSSTPSHHLRFRVPVAHLSPVFGNDWFARGAESFARFFGTPVFLIGQTLIVVAWIAVNATGKATFDAYPFILLNLAFSLQAAYAAPLILLAQTRQADRDKANAEADALHREAISQAGEQRSLQLSQQSAALLALMEQNTRLTEVTKQLSERIESLTAQLHQRIVLDGKTDPA